MKTKTILAILGLGLSLAQAAPVSIMVGTGVNRPYPARRYPPQNTPNEVFGLIIWLKADALVLNNNDLIASWTDNSGRNNHFTQTGGDALKPIFHTGQINSLPAVYFPFSSNNGLSLPSYADGTPTEGECFAVVKSDADPASDPGGGWLWDFSTQGDPDGFVDNNGDITIAWGRSTRTNVGNPTPSFASWRRINIWSKSADYSLQIDGTTFFSTGVNTVSFNATPRFSKQAVIYSGHIAEYIQYNRKLDTIERGMVDGYLKAKYALP